MLIVIVVLLALAVLFYTYFVQVRHVKAGEIGIKASVGNPIDNGEDFDIQAVKGYVFFMPIYTDFTTYPTTMQIVPYDSMRIVAKDGVQFYVKPSISYQLDEKKVVQYYRAFRKPLNEINQTYLKELVSTSYATAANGFGSDSLVNNQKQFETALNTILSARMSEIGLDLKNVVSNLQVPQQLKDIIALRGEALQNAILAEDKRKQAEAEALIQVVNADAARQGDSLKNAALTPLSIQKMFIDKWDGKLPVYGETPKIYKNITE